MKKVILALSLIIIFIQTGRSQGVITDDEWGKVINCLEKEDWPGASKLSKQYLQKIPKEKLNDYDAANLRYMYIFSNSGLMNDGRISHETALNNVKEFVGMKVKLPGHPIALKQGFNTIDRSSGKTDTLFITASNRAKTQILCFEYIVMSKPFSNEKFEKSEGKICRLTGTLKSIRVDGNLIPRYRMMIEQAEGTIDE
ncbi:hypothetical protein [Mucilaginibacter sp. L3T2-6]|uniref:hypothetical protein n=1 Tax=Mucilaginibacter sp. L3T2-6 TaxID=3062491 RepID=UPI00267565A3|nr:hypothetical protein [Mucilaginibacter sp. L3T2-6]MDO3644453.1 hypothetical protein [Mucilaginibacter sp. L3T2-6]MDV6216905.1 hypothetical protein [Mucilaginibacter sp. L3T2-6]